MNVHFEKGKLPDGKAGVVCVVDRGPDSVAVFPADAMVPDDGITYREKFAKEYAGYEKHSAKPAVAHSKSHAAAKRQIKKK